MAAPVLVVMPLDEMVRRYEARPGRLPLANLHLAIFEEVSVVAADGGDVAGKPASYRAVRVLCGERSQAWFVLERTEPSEVDCLDCGLSWCGGKR